MFFFHHFICLRSQPTSLSEYIFFVRNFEISLINNYLNNIMVLVKKIKNNLPSTLQTIGKSLLKSAELLLL